MQRQIEGTDRQSEAVVEELYELTEEEVAVVEGRQRAEEQSCELKYARAPICARCGSPFPWYQMSPIHAASRALMRSKRSGAAQCRADRFGNKRHVFSTPG